MKDRTHSLNEIEMELVKLLMAECKSTRDIQAKLNGTSNILIYSNLKTRIGVN